MEDHFDPYYKWLGIPPQEQPANHYRLLGIVLFESDLDVIESAADRQMAHVRTFQTGRYSEQSQEVLNAVSAAKVCLLKPAQKTEYDRELRAKLETEKAMALERQTTADISPLQKAPLTSSPVPVAFRPAARDPSTDDRSSNQQSQVRISTGSSRTPRKRSPGLTSVVAGLAAVLVLAMAWMLYSQFNRVDDRSQASLQNPDDRMAPDSMRAQNSFTAKSTKTSAPAASPQTAQKLAKSTPAEIKPKPQQVLVDVPKVDLQANVRSSTKVTPKPAPPLASIGPAQPTVLPEAPSPPFVPPADEKEGEADLRVARWVLSVGGTLQVRTTDGRSTLIVKGDLPSVPFYLEQLTLTSTRAQANGGAANLLGLKHLQSASLYNRSITDAELQLLPSFKSLQTLEFSSSGITDAGLAHLKNLPNLTSLGLGSCKITDQGLALLKSLGTLEELKLDSNRAVTDAGLQHLAALPKLRKLNLDLTAITNDGLQELAKLPNTWERLILRRTKISGPGLQSLRLSSALTEISLEGTGIDDDSLSAIAACDNLTYLNLTDCISLTDAGLKHLQGLRKLRHFYLSGTKITSEGLKNLQQITSLEVLFINRTGVTDDGLKYLEQCQSLNTLSLSECSITDVGLQHLLGLKRLNSLYIGKTAITDAGKQALNDAIPRCKIH